ncbi:MAG: hypothetical protein V7K40_14890 [Nostoc sp.]|uniref:WD40 repeat domain-containing protein n=1 Tax=Nostoc sp. TaxID=1180 RepID=UPI002FFC28BA
MIKLWDVTTGAQIHTIQAHSCLVSSVAFSPDGKTIASGSSDNTIKLWDVGTAREIYTLKRHSHSCHVTSVAFSLDGKKLASASFDKTINIWQLASSTTTPTSSSVQPNQSQLSQTNQSANLPSPNKVSKQSIFQSAVAQNTSLSVNPTSAKNQTSNKAVNNTSQKSSTTNPIIPILSILGSTVLRYLIPSSLIWWVLGAFFIIFIIGIIITSIKK